MRIKQISLICCLFFSISCKNAESSNSGSSKSSDYPSIIDSLNLKNVYDETKWIMYCYQCDDTLIFIKRGMDSGKIYFSSLDLKFDTVIVDKEQTEINLSFMYKGEICDDELVRNSPIRGVVFNNSYDSVLYYTITSHSHPYLSITCPDMSNCPSRFVNPLQPEVVKFINDHKAELNPWFYKMAQKKGILK